MPIKHTGLQFITLAHIVTAWSYTGHQLIATIATNYLTPTASDQISTILDSLPLSSIAAWADTIRWLDRYKWTSQLHYISSAGDDPPRTCAVTWTPPSLESLYSLHNKDDINNANTETSVATAKGFSAAAAPEGYSMDVISAVHNYTNTLLHATPGTWRESESLRFLVHFLQDLHQPLHLSSRARGGNDVVVRFGGYKTNLHKVWDGLGLLERMKDVYHRNTTTTNPFATGGSSSSSGSGTTTSRQPGRPVSGRSVKQGQYQELESEKQGRQSDGGTLEDWKEAYTVYIHNLLASPKYTHLRTTTWLYCPHTSLLPKYGCPEIWARDVAPINCAYVWPGIDVVETRGGGGDYGHDIKDEDQDVNEWVVSDDLEQGEYWDKVVKDQVIEEVVMKAAVRLAAVLNAVFEERKQIHEQMRQHVSL